MLPIILEVPLKNVLYDWGRLNVALFRAINETANSSREAYRE